LCICPTNISSSTSLFVSVFCFIGVEPIKAESVDFLITSSLDLQVIACLILGLEVSEPVVGDATFHPIIIGSSDKWTIARYVEREICRNCRAVGEGLACGDLPVVGSLIRYAIPADAGVIQGLVTDHLTVCYGRFEVEISSLAGVLPVLLIGELYFISRIGSKTILRG